MKTLLSSLMATALAASFAVPLPMNAQAAPVYVPSAPSAPAADQGQPQVQKAAHTYRHWRRQQRRAERRSWRRYAYRRGYYRDPYYYRGGHYGFAPRYYRHRYYRRPGVTLEFNF